VAYSLDLTGFPDQGVQVWGSEILVLDKIPKRYRDLEASGGSEIVFQGPVNYYADRVMAS
jgi:hypothetical protein